MQTDLRLGVMCTFMPFVFRLPLAYEESRCLSVDKVS